MILYRRGNQLRVRRWAAPEPPFWCASAVAPYSARRTTPLAIDYLALQASGAERLDVMVCDSVRDQLERGRTVSGPLLVEATGNTEVVFRRGDDALAWCESETMDAVHLISTLGTAPSRLDQNITVVVAAWPAELRTLESLAESLRPFRWGVLVPVLYPLTTDLALLESLADLAQRTGAGFLAAAAIDLAPTAKQVLARGGDMTGDDDRYATLFHGEVGPIHLATERHVAALAAERTLADFVVPPRWEQRSNWNAAITLTRTASRMIAMELDLDLAGTIARSARTVADLKKPLALIAESASVSIVAGLGETSAEILTEWLVSGTASFVDWVDDQWRLRRG